jgi:hypothetical protein
LAATFGDGRAEFCQLKGTDERVESAAEPNAKEEPVTRKSGGYVTWGTNDTGRNGVANGDSDAEADTEDLE